MISLKENYENVKKYLIENPEVMDEVEKKVRDNFAKAFSFRARASVTDISFSALKRSIF